MSAAEPGQRRWYHHALAILITAHLFIVAVHLIPVPPRTDDKALALPEVAEEIEHIVSIIHATGLYDGTPEELRAEGIEWVREYKRQHEALTAFTETWLRPIGSTQNWNMFGGGAKKHPMVMVVEVRPRGSRQWEVLEDGRWGGDHVDHRHRKIRRNLNIPGRKGRRKQYAAYFARRWNTLHPDRPAQRVRMTFHVHHTRTAAQVNAGVPPRPTDETLPFSWKVPQ